MQKWAERKQVEQVKEGCWSTAWKQRDEEAEQGSTRWDQWREKMKEGVRERVGDNRDGRGERETEDNEKYK